MAQSAKAAALRVIISHGADAGHAVANPRAQTHTAVIAVGGRDLHGFILPPPLKLYLCRLRTVLPQKLLQMLRGCDFFAVEGQEQIALPDAAFLGRAFPAHALQGGHIHHQHAVGKELDAHRLAQGDHGFLLGVCALHTGCKRQHSRRAQCCHTPPKGLAFGFIHAATPRFFIFLVADDMLYFVPSKQKNKRQL